MTKTAKNVHVTKRSRVWGYILWKISEFCG